MKTIKNFDTFFLVRNGERIWVKSALLAILSPTSPYYLPGGLSVCNGFCGLSLSGMIYRCDRLSSFFYGKADLRSPSPPDLSEVIIETWHTNDRKLYTFEHSFILYNVVPSNFRHAECSCCCDINLDKIEIVEADKRQINLMEESWWLKPEYLKESNESKVILNEE